MHCIGPATLLYTTSHLVPTLRKNLLSDFNENISGAIANSGAPHLPA
ncbi:MAG: hypothetical protein WBC06_17610 [Chitinophagaceae bacterium]